MDDTVVFVLGFWLGMGVAWPVAHYIGARRLAKITKERDDLRREKKWLAQGRTRTRSAVENEGFTKISKSKMRRRRLQYRN